MKKFSGYAETEVHEFIQYDKLNLGPHYCKITDVREISAQGQAGPYSYLQVNIDTTDKDEQPQFYLKRYKQDVDQDAQTAKWRGVYRVFIPDDDGSEKDNKKKEMFKSFITKSSSDISLIFFYIHLPNIFLLYHLNIPCLIKLDIFQQIPQFHFLL